jgi:hypothetical protein
VSERHFVDFGGPDDLRELDPADWSEIVLMDPYDCPLCGEQRALRGACPRCGANEADRPTLDEAVAEIAAWTGNPSPRL